MRSFLIIGAGKFGTHLALELYRLGNEVMLVDREETKINEVSCLVTAAEIGDYTIKSNLEALGISDFDYIFVCMSDFKNSLMIIDYLKELGAKNIVAKASGEVHEKFLIKNGADRVIYPERDFALTTAVEYSNRKIFDFIKLSDDTAIYEIEVPNKWCSHTLATLDVRRKHNVSVLASKSNGRVVAINSADYIFKKDEHIYVMGTQKDVAKLTK